jgi:6-pyruvoyltetrahydropterin/6-carboxytetrahydropterin synthase
MSTYTVTRQIGIDAGHRVMTHGSKCRHLHGHRYTIEATCLADHLQAGGEQSDMVLDFGFLKEEMLTQIDAPCDHGFLAHVEDAELLAMFRPEDAEPNAWLAAIRDTVQRDGYCLTRATRMGTKLYVLGVNPTAEQLCRHWFNRLKPVVTAKSGGLAQLQEIVVWETPHCRAAYREP